MVRFLGFGITILEFVAPQLALKITGDFLLRASKVAGSGYSVTQCYLGIRLYKMRTDVYAANKAIQTAVVIRALLAFSFMCCSALMQGSPPGARKKRLRTQGVFQCQSPPWRWTHHPGKPGLSLVL